MFIISVILYAILGVVMVNAGLQLDGYYFAILGLVVAIDVISYLRARTER